MKNRIENMLRVAAITPIVHIGNLHDNIVEIAGLINKVNNQHKNVSIIATPELCTTGYTCQDMFNNHHLLNQLTIENLDKILKEYIAPELNIHQFVVIGTPLYINGQLYNCSLLLSKNRILGIVPKTYLPNYNEFYEKRWFTSGKSNHATAIKEVTTEDYRIPFGTDIIFELDEVKLGLEVCEDLWSPIPPSSKLAVAGANIIINNSASNEVIGKKEYRRSLVSQQSARCICGYIYCSAGVTESTQDVVFSGHSIIAENGSILKESELFEFNSNYIISEFDMDKIAHDRISNKTFNDTIDFSGQVQDIRTIKCKGPITYLDKLTRQIKIEPFTPSNNIGTRCRDIFEMQVAGLARRLQYTKSKKLVVGVSGGLDSTLALLVSVAAVKKCGRDPKTVLGITMPCFGTTSRTKSNAVKLMEVLECDTLEINIADSVKQHMKDIGLDENDRSIAYENAQARERTQVLMDVANKVGGFVVGTGDLSELALGWCTYNGDHMSMYNVNGSIPKTLVRTLVKNIAVRFEKLGYVQTNKSKDMIDCINDILDTPISPELLPPSTDNNIMQLTEDSVGPYVLNDFFIYYKIRFGMSPSKVYALAVESCRQNNLSEVYTKEEIKKWLKKFYIRFGKAQVKRNVCPDGLKVGTVSFNPRGDWRMSSEFDMSTLLEEVDNL